MKSYYKAFEENKKTFCTEIPAKYDLSSLFKNPRAIRQHLLLKLINLKNPPEIIEQNEDLVDILCSKSKYEDRKYSSISYKENKY